MSENRSEAIEHLLTGYRDFVNDEYSGDHTLMGDLAGGQQPKVLVIGCCDSRVDPALVFRARPGDIFVLRSIANAVPPFESAESTHLHTSATIEFAVDVLGIEEIVVLGHSGCAGVRAALDIASNKPLDGLPNVASWLSNIAHPCEKALRTAGEQNNDDTKPVTTVAEQQSVLNSLANLKQYPSVQKALVANRIGLHGWWFDIRSGDLLITSNDAGEFKRVEQGA